MGPTRTLGVSPLLVPYQQQDILSSQCTFRRQVHQLHVAQAQQYLSVFLKTVAVTCWKYIELPKENYAYEDVHPPKTNMEPENGPLEKEIPIGNHHFQVPC